MTAARRPADKSVIRFDRMPVTAETAPSRRAEDIRFFVTVWAMGFVVFYNFLF